MVFVQKLCGTWWSGCIRLHKVFLTQNLIESYLKAQIHVVPHVFCTKTVYGPKIGVDYGHFTHIGWQFRAKFRAEYDPLCKNRVPHGFCTKTMWHKVDLSL